MFAFETGSAWLDARLRSGFRMAFKITNPEADRLARQLAEVTGLAVSDFVVIALREQLKREMGGSLGEDLRKC